MNEQWRDDEKAAHESKADALGIAIAALEGVRPILSIPLDGMAAQLLVGLKHERDGHEQQAKLAGSS
jgi:hypothetical protein